MQRHLKQSGLSQPRPSFKRPTAKRSTGGKKFVCNVVMLSKGDSKRMGLGTYSRQEAAPRFSLAFKPNAEKTIDVSLERLEIPGTSKYMLFYHLHNMGETSCEITIQRSDGATSR